MHYLIKVPDTPNRNNEDAANKIKSLLFVMLEFGYSKLIDNNYEIKLDNDNVRRRKEYRAKRTAKEAEAGKLKK